MLSPFGQVEDESRRKDSETSQQRQYRKVDLTSCQRHTEVSNVSSATPIPNWPKETTLTP